MAIPPENILFQLFLNRYFKMYIDYISQTIQFLKEELKLPQESIDLAIKKSPVDRQVLPIVLWQYGLVTLSQLDAIYTRLDSYV